MTTTSASIRLRRGTAAQWSADNPVLGAGEYGFETDTGRGKIGDGTTAWSALAYQTPLVGTSAGTIAAGDDSRITGAAQKTANLSDLTSASTARTNLGLGSVDNTADTAKPVSTPQATAIAAVTTDLRTTRAILPYGLMDAENYAERGSHLITAAVVSPLQSWLAWLDANSASGALTELGWPSPEAASSPVTAGQHAANWNPTADAYLAVLGDRGIPVIQWLSTNDGSGNPTDLNAMPGWLSGPSGSLTVGTNPMLAPGAMPILRYNHAAYRGFQCTSGMIQGGTAFVGYGAVNPTWGGFRWADFTIAGGAAMYQRMAQAGLDTVRMAFQWEGIQATLGGTLDTTVLATLATRIATAQAAGLKVILVPWDGGYYQYNKYGTTTATNSGSSVAVGGTINFNSSASTLKYSGNECWPTVADGSQFDVTINSQRVRVHRTATGTLTIDAITLPAGASTISWSSGNTITSGPYQLGDSQLTSAHVANLWSRLATWLNDPAQAAILPAIHGLELMNEPHHGYAGTFKATLTATASSVGRGGTLTVNDTSSLPATGTFGATVNGSSATVFTCHVGSGTTLIVDSGTVSGSIGQEIRSPQLQWQEASQAAVTAIRAVDTATRIYVPGWQYTSVSAWASNHPVGWITDPNTNFAYAGHHYWSAGTNDSAYDGTFASEVSARIFSSNSGGYVQPEGDYSQRLVGPADRLRPRGHFTLSRAVATATLTAMTSGTMYLTVFEGEEDTDITALRAMIAAAGSSDATLAKLGLYTVSSGRNITLRASTAHNAALFGATGLVASQTLTPGWTLRKGVLYAVGALMVGASSPAQLQGVKSIPDYTRWPQMAFTVTGQTDLPAYVASASVLNASEAFYATAL